MNDLAWVFEGRGDLAARWRDELFAGGIPAVVVPGPSHRAGFPDRVGVAPAHEKRAKRLLTIRGAYRFRPSAYKGDPVVGRIVVAFSVIGLIAFIALVIKTFLHL